MDRIRKWHSPPGVAYEPIEEPADYEDELDSPISQSQSSSPFSRPVYWVFFILGVSMLWAWNMFLAAAPFFRQRFQSNTWVTTHYQSSILTVSTVTNLTSAFVLAKVQQSASYPRRIIVSLLINIAVFTLLAFSTLVLKHASVIVYFGFLMSMVFGASMATGINQNGVFAYVSGFGREEYTQAIMSGQGVAGVLPCLAQMLSGLAVPEEGEEQAPDASWKSAFACFITATGVSSLTLVAFVWLTKRQSLHIVDDSSEASNANQLPTKTVSLWTLFLKLRLPAISIFLCFVVTMVFPVYTSRIESVRGTSDASRLFQPAAFIPLAFFFWNAGDLLARMLVLNPRYSLAHRPWALLILSIARAGFIPLYQLCNIGGLGAIVNSDFFYLFIVQLLFGATNGYLSSCCMMGASYWVSAEEREPAGGFMSLMLVGGLAAGSLLSFFASGT
ncbi:nucleoside transporter-domain-containing protein [Aspergillus pseudodeflectus]|uniref:Nucleoside transporter-domain-containing protein n=1 Tax=Aspergillus pseudodeflectus TaxID=176178 RepID=A0ABR4LAB5_9EURO